MTIPEPHWPIPGCPDYAYTADFEVFRLTPGKGTRAGRFRKGVIDAYGYHIWAVPMPDGRQTSVRRSNLVCAHFHGPRPEGCWALHNDGNPLNDIPSNLRWGTPAENSADMIRHGRARTAEGDGHGTKTKPWAIPRGEQNGRSKLTADQARQIRSAPGRYVDVAAQFGISKSVVNAIKNRQTWRHI